MSTVQSGAGGFVAPVVVVHTVRRSATKVASACKLEGTAAPAEMAVGLSAATAYRVRANEVAKAVTWSCCPMSRKG